MCLKGIKILQLTKISLKRLKRWKCAASLPIVVIIGFHRTLMMCFFIVVHEGEVFLHVDFTCDTELLFSLLCSCSTRNKKVRNSGVFIIKSLFMC